MTALRRLDHVAVLVRNTEEALLFYRDRLGLRVKSSEEIATPHARLTYLDAGNAYLQLVEPLDAASPLAATLDQQGENLHHICFAVDDVPAAAATLNDDDSPLTMGVGRGRASSFLSTAGSNGVRIELTSFDPATDID